MSTGRLGAGDTAIQPTILDAKGDLIVATAADTPARLAVGSANQVLTVDSSTSTGLKWATPAAGGKVLQVVQGTYSTQVTNGTNTYADTGLTATITPSSTSSKVLVIVAQNGVAKRTGTGAGANAVVLNLLRGSTGICLFAGGIAWTGTNLDNIVGSTGVTFLDTPATTSATTYKTQFKNDFNGTNVQVQINSEVSTITLLEIGA
jgi:hypothetical protein